MCIRNNKDHTLMKYALDFFILAILGYGIYRVLRQRVKRRRQADIEIPEFLSGRSDAVNNLLGNRNADWTEVFPARKR